MANCGWDQVGPTGFSKVTSSFLTRNPVSSYKYPLWFPRPQRLRRPGSPSQGRIGGAGRCGQQGAAVGTRCYSGGGGAGNRSPGFRAVLSPPPLAPPLPPHGEGEGAEPSPETGGVRVPSAPLPPAGLSWLPEAGVSRKSSQRGRNTERTETSSSPSEKPY